MGIKRLERKYPQIVIFREKHSNRYYIAQNENEFYSIYFAVLEERFEQGDYRYFKETKASIPKEEGYITLEQVNLIPEIGGFKEQALERYKKQQKEIVRVEQIHETYDDIVKAVANKDVNFAYYFLRDNEGDYIQVEDPLTFKKI